MKKVVIFSSIFLVISSILGYFLFFYDKVEVTLNGKNNLEIEVNTKYEDEGFTLKNRNKVISKEKYELKINNNIKEDVLGTYTIKYDIKYKRKNYTLERIVKVIDTTPPTIESNKETITKDYCSKKIKDELKYTASDNYDGDLTNKIKRTDNEDNIILKVADSSNNETIKEIKINMANKPKNKFTLNGKKSLRIPLNGTYQESGAYYADGCGNKIDKTINIKGTIDTTILGEYIITYEVDGNVLSRKVTVYDPTKEVKTSGKVIYLTFDDGPGYYTNKILNILDKYNVKATFFVTHQFPSYMSLIKTEHDKGHVVAVHTYTHNYKTVYTSVDDYINDFNKMNEVIKEYTGSYSKLFRFPGGSSNTVSKSYSKGVVSEIAKKMTENGYVYFDWNVSSGDASGAGSNTIYNKVVNGVKSCNSCVVLMHDIKGTTANALDNILNTLTSEGYKFSTLNENSYTAHHSIAN